MKRNELEFVPINNSKKNAERRAMESKRARQIARQRKIMRRRFITALSFVVLLLSLAVTITALCCKRNVAESTPTSAMPVINVNNTVNNTVNNGLTIVEVTQSEMDRVLREQVNAGLLVEEVDSIPSKDSVIDIVTDNASIVEELGLSEDTVDVVMFDVPLDADLQKYLLDVANEYGVEPSLIVAVIDKESDFDPNARSKSGDSGLMQVNDCNLSTLKRELGIDDIYDPYQNILGGTYILSECLDDTNGDIQLALMCYNMGLKNAKSCWSKGIYSSSYSRDVYYMYTEIYQ